MISAEQAVTLHGLFLERVRRSPNAIAYRHFDLQQNEWIDLTWQQMRDQVARWQAALLGEGLAVGDRVAVMMRNCPQWVMYEQAALSLGLVVVPLYTVDRPENVAYIVNDAGARVILFETAEQWQALNTVRDKMPGVQRFLSLNAIEACDEARLQAIFRWLPVHATLAPARQQDAAALATIMYTSGTTGRPKGVMLSNDNIVQNAYAALLTCHIGPGDTMLSFLPLSHTFERTAGYYMPMMAGVTVAYARSIPQLSEDLKIIRPTLLVSVPRIFERVYGAILSKLAEGPRLRRELFSLTVDVGWHRFERQQGRAAWHPKLLLWPLLNRLVARKVMDRLGGRLRLSVSGGAALPPDVSRTFIALGLPILQGYGMTETSPIVCVNRMGNNFPTSVGTPLQGISVRIGEQDALLVKGHGNMQGYWNNPEATRAIIDAEGWLNTGDTARISETGHIYITGRLKEIIVMSNGEKIPPADMELNILRDSLFDQVMVYGEGKPYLVALVVLNADAWRRLAVTLNVDSEADPTLKDSRVEQHVLARVTDQIAEFPGYARIRRVCLLRDPWTIESGLLTPTLKIKRDQVVERFAEQIKDLYAGH
ncbi:MAG TPA: long-chain fatty acid--CoA ligase [Gallionellaceae bacterium]|nr:long-chain fatty acid--CoA ligase [Gallionellaceae bacterium]